MVEIGGRDDGFPPWRTFHALAMLRREMPTHATKMLAGNGDVIGRNGRRGPFAPVRVLDVDRDLADALDDQELEEARCALVAPSITLTKGDWSPRQAVPAEGGHLGVLVTDGILCREVVIGDSVCAELVGPGDLLRPWDGGGASLLVSCDVQWHVVKEARLAILGRGFATLAARWPALTSAFVGRAISRSHALALSATISCTTGLEARLLMLFWHMADRWGRVRRDGVVVPIRLTHDLIGRLIGARRPSVSTALKQLERQGLITRLPDGEWLLAGDPPSSAGEQRGQCPDGNGDGRPNGTSRAANHGGQSPPLDLASESRAPSSGDRRRADGRKRADGGRTRRSTAATPGRPRQSSRLAPAP